MRFPLMTRAVHRFVSGAISSVFLLSFPSASHAGCGCDKPPPPPAAVIPQAAFAGMAVTLFHPDLQVGQTWTVTFHNSAASVATSADVTLKRAITDPTGHTYTPQLTVIVPADTPPGPTKLIAATEEKRFQIPRSAFTVIGKPVAFAEQNATYETNDYSTAVGADGTLYMAAGGLNAVCKAMKFQTRLIEYPLRFASGAITIMNSQGFLVDALIDPNDPTLGVRRRFSLISKEKDKSDRLIYRRHSFAQYCQDHQPGGPKEVDSWDPNWHMDGTPHVDYSTLIFAIEGNFDDGTTPAVGSVTFGVEIESEIDLTNAPWTIEVAEESLL